MAGDDPAVQRHFVTRPYQDDLADCDCLDRSAVFDPAAPHDRFARRQIDERPDGLARPLQGSRFEPLRQGEQKDDAGGFEPFAERQGPRDRDDHEDIDVHGLRANRCNCPARRIHAPHQCADGEAQRSREHQIERGGGEPGGKGDPRADRQPEPCAHVGPGGTGLLVLQPHAHPGLPDRIDHFGRGQLCRVILDVQALAHHVGGNRFETGERLQAPFQDHDFLVAVHALDAEHGFRVKLARGACHLGGTGHGRGLAAGLLHVSQTLTKEREHVLVIEGVENHPAFTPGADDASVPEQTQLVGNRRLGHAKLAGQVAHAQLGARQRVENPHPRGIAEDAKDLGQTVDGVGVKL